MAVQASYAAFDWSGSEPIQLVTIPDECPHCHRAIQPRVMGGVARTEDHRVFEFAFQCVHSECHRVFTASYGRRNSTSCLLISVGFKTPVPHEFSEEIVALSPMFQTVYNQSVQAEAADLDEIAGMGYRKALEFLIKDFAIVEHPDEAEAIRKRLLGQCIESYIADPNLKTTAKRAAWLGNDETHYVRKWEDRDIRDLKLLIRLAVNWVENVLLTRKYEKEMPG